MTACGQAQTNELGSSGDPSESVNRRPAPSEGSAPQPANAPAVRGEQAESFNRQHGSPEDGSTYVAVLAGSVVPFQPSGSLKPTAIDSDPF